jgi:hypothetical protein
MGTRRKTRCEMMKRTMMALVLLAAAAIYSAAVASAASVCRQCHPTCTACDGVSLFDCTRCVTDRFLDSDGSCRAYLLSCPPEPRLDCAEPAAGAGKAVLKVKRNQTKPKGSKIGFSWKKGIVQSVADFGSPVSLETNYALCLYDYSGDAPELKFQGRVPRGKGWRLLSDQRGFLFQNVGNNSSSEGIARIILKRRASDGRAQVVASGRGKYLSDIQPAAPEQLFNVDTRVTAQIINDVPRCWEAEFDQSTVLRNLPLAPEKFMFKGSRKY